MARPLRRVLIGLSIRLNQPLREIEQLSLKTIREYLAMLGEINKPSPKSGTPTLPRVQTPEEIADAFMAAFGKSKKKG